MDGPALLHSHLGEAQEEPRQYETVEIGGNMIGGFSDKSFKLEVLTCGNMFPMAMQFWISLRCSGPLWKKSIQQLSLN